MRSFFTALALLLCIGISLEKAETRELKACPVQYSQDGSQVYEFITETTCDRRGVVRIHDFALDLSCIIVSTIVGECVKGSELSGNALKNYEALRSNAPKNDSYVPCLLVSKEQGIQQEMGRLNFKEKGCEHVRLIRRIDTLMRRACPVYVNIPLSCAVLEDGHPFLTRVAIP